MRLEEMEAKGLRYLDFKGLVNLGIVNSRPTLHRWIKSGTFPKPIYPEPGTPRWLVEELLSWEKQKIADRANV